MADAAVRETDNDAAVSRLSAVRKGYMEDEFASFFVKRAATRPPLINIGTYLRTWSIDRLVDAFLAGDGRRQFVSLGAGTDTRFFRIASGSKYTEQAARLARYVEIDFPEATSKKAMFIRKQNNLAELLKEPVKLEQGGTSLISEQYCLIPGDLREFHQDLAARLLEVLDPGIPTLFLAECVFIYLDPQHSSNILRWMTEHFGQAGSMTILYDPVGLADNFGKVMVNNLQARGLSLLGMSANASLQALEERLKAHGFSHAHAESIKDIRKGRLSEEEQRLLSALEMLDEVEELDLLTSHYSIAWAYTSSLSNDLAARIARSLGEDR